MAEDEFVWCEGFASAAAAEVAAAALRASGIEAMLRESDPLGGLGVPGQAVLLVRINDLPAARDVLVGADVQNSREGPPRWNETDAERPVRPDVVLAGLATIRHRRRLMWFWLLSYLPVGALVMMLGPELLVVPVVIFWMAAFAVSSWVAGNSRCPRCGNRFFRRLGLSNPYARQCLHCGLHLRATTAA